jgi:hypothetical protein
VPVDECRCLGCYQTIADLYSIIRNRKKRLRGPCRKYTPMVKTQRDRLYARVGSLYKKSRRSAPKRSPRHIRLKRYNFLGGYN